MDKKTSRNKIKWKLVKKQINKLVFVEFDDHSQNGTPMVCHVVGFLSEITNKHIKVISWDCPGEETSVRDDNMEYCCILKSTINKIYPLKKTKKWG